MSDETPRQETPDEAAKRRGDAEKPAPAGPHDRPGLTDPDKTPGTGSLPEPKGGEADAGVG